MLRQLSREQIEEFNKAKITLPPSDEPTYELCLLYYSQYKTKTGYIGPDKVQLALKCAFFMAEKSQCIDTVSGQKIRLPSLSLSQLLKNHKLDDIMIMLKDFSKKIIDTIDKQTGNEINNIIRQISFLITFHTRFQKVIKKLQFQDNSQNSEYFKTFSSFIWLLYVEAKNYVLNRSLQLIENTCILAHSFAFMLIYSWNYLKPQCLLKGDRALSEQSTRKQISMVIKQRILQMFLIKNVDVYKNYANGFQNYFQQLADRGIIKTSGNQKTDFLSTQMIYNNYNRFDTYYRKKLTHNDLDERIFFKQRAINLTPSKFTPFARQGYANKAVKNNIKLFGNFNNNNPNDATINKQNFSSHRILNYDLIDKQQTSQKIPSTTTINELKLPQAVLQSPSMMKIPLICSTPITTGMQMFNYINEKHRKLKQLQNNIITRKSDEKIYNHISRIYDYAKKQDKKNKQVKINLIFSFFKLASQQYITTNNINKENIRTLQAICALVIEIYFFVSNITFTLKEIQNQMEIETMEEWKACDFLLKFDRTMPSTLKLHLLDIQVNLISWKIWKQSQIINNINDYLWNKKELNCIQKLFKRILHQIAFQITQLGQLLKVDEYQLECIFETMKHIISNCLQMMFDRHMDQMLICSFYANCKTQSNSIKFMQIWSKYQQINQHNKDQHDSIMLQIYLKDNDQAIDIITYYNSQFVMVVGSFIKALRDKYNHSTHSNHSSHNRKISKAQPNSILQSPLKSIIPNQMNFRNNTKKGQKQANNTNTNNISQTNLLYAYNQSPILKYESHAFKGTLNSKKILNFEQGDDILLKKCLEVDDKKETQVSSLSPRTFTNEFGAKKFGVWKGTNTAKNTNENNPTPTRTFKPHQHNMHLHKHIHVPISKNYHLNKYEHL